MSPQLRLLDSRARIAREARRRRVLVIAEQLRVLRGSVPR